MRYDGKASMKGHGYQVHAGVNRPTSRGRIRINSADAEAKPSILFNYLETERDIQDWRDCIRLTREILNQPALDEYRGDEESPGIEVNTDNQIDAWVRANVESAYHPSCTCKMGADNDPMAVVNSSGKVIGIEKLRVVDSSIFPSITNGNLNAPTLMVAEKMADVILCKKPLSQSNVDVWIDPDWQNSQRQGNAKRLMKGP
jgi:choline dehydrogenase